MAVLPSTKKAHTYTWEARDRAGKLLRGEMAGAGESFVSVSLRRQGLTPMAIKRKRFARGKSIKDKDVTVFTRQMSTMMRAGVPLLQSFDIVAKGHSNPSMQRLLQDIKSDIESGTSMSTAFAKHPKQFDKLFCNLVAAGEKSGALEALLDRLAIYKEKTMSIRGKIKSAMFYPAAVVVVAFVVTAIIMLFVVPAFKDLFNSFGASLPMPTLILLAVSNFFVAYWYLIFGGLAAAVVAFVQGRRRNQRFHDLVDQAMLKLPIFGQVLQKGAIARWCRTLSTMFSAGVPLAEALGSVAGAAGNVVYEKATRRVQTDVISGESLTLGMQRTGVFPNMVLQMAAIGEESGALDAMLGKAAEFFEDEVDRTVDSLSSLMEPMIMVVLGTLIGAMVVAMYLPIFQMGQVVN